MIQGSKNIFAVFLGYHCAGNPSSELCEKFGAFCSSDFNGSIWNIPVEADVVEQAQEREVFIF